MYIMRKRQITLVLSCVIAVLGLSGLEAAEKTERVVECRNLFPSDLSASDLELRFGIGNVVTADVYLGEGYYEVGTVLFPNSPKDRVEFRWYDREGRRFPRSIGLKDQESSWRTAQGIGMGTDLLTVERLNGKPFRLRGYGADGSGRTMSWQSGHLEKETGCALRLRLMSSADPKPLSPSQAQLARQIDGGQGTFSSGHPAFQALNPPVDRIWLEFAQPNNSLQRP
jgi:hypothetical protein